MNLGWAVLLVDFNWQALFADMAHAHGVGASFALSNLGAVQNKAINTSTSEIPGFVTANPPEASLDNGSIGDAAVVAAISNSGASVVKESSAQRQSFRIDPTTDPMLLNADRAVLNPEQTMNEIVMETPGGDDGEGDEIIACEEGGDEYVQRCVKNLDVQIRVIPEIKVTSGPYYRNQYFKKGEPKCGEHHGCNGLCKAWYDTVITQHRKVEITNEGWIDGCAVLEANSDQGFCRYVAVDEGTPETRTITGPVVNSGPGNPATDSEPITRESWVKRYTYSCFKKVEGDCHKLSAKGCVQISSVCSEQIGDVCVTHRKTYRCPKGKRKQKRYRSVGETTPFCFTGDCANNDYEANGEINDAMSQLLILKATQDDIRAQSEAQGQNLRIFKGLSRRCRKAWNGARDCCGSGNRWAVSWKLAPGCDAAEDELGDWRAKKRCVEVGTYCAKKLPVIGCIEKKTTYCCFGTKLSKLLQEQGRRQLGISWGDPESPECRGLTTDELSRIDMSKMDLSELYEDVKANFKPQSQGHIAKGIELDRIRENMQHLSCQGKKGQIAEQQRREKQLAEIQKQKDQQQQFFEEQNQGLEQEMLRTQAQGELKSTIDALTYSDPIDRGDGWILGWNSPALAPRIKPHLAGLSFDDQIKVLDRFIASPSSANIARVLTGYNNGRYAPMTYESLKKGLEGYKQALVGYHAQCGEIHQIPESQEILQKEQELKDKKEALKAEHQKQEWILDEQAKELMDGIPNGKRDGL